MSPRLRFLLLLAPALLAGCDLLGIETLSQQQARRAEEGKAIGSACRHAGRAIEDCYALNKKADKAAIFAGWREMNDYMAENKIEVLQPSLPSPEAMALKQAAAEAAAAAEEEAYDEPPAPRGKKSAHGG
ncbi:hypothetical protein [Rubrivivax albus]|uniref:Uncharacterized protein n=1 Tax=Rubrivivax albus TaxID=2499835 RepID=A0A3S2UQ70_9BURK|nr:hypothetical protein [Rubrivivax albus]RVT51612.1 hypothetical protein ENE75_12405 [Rubrivivax albus]